MISTRFARIWIAGLLMAMFLLASLGTFAHADDAAPAAKRIVYFWQGRDAFSIITTEAKPDFLAAFSEQETTIESRPSNERILEMLSKATLVYTNSHAGVPSDKVDGLYQQVLKSGESAKPTFLTATQIAALRDKVGVDKLPLLTVIDGCEVLEEVPANVPTIPAALGIMDKTPGRAIIGFTEPIKGVGRDHYFRQFFRLWCAKQENGSYLTLAQARDEALKWVRTSPDTHLPADSTEKIAQNIERAMRIRGDDTLRYPDLFPPKLVLVTVQKTLPPNMHAWSINVTIRSAGQSKTVTDVVVAANEDGLTEAEALKKAELEKKNPEADIIIRLGAQLQSPADLPAPEKKDN